MTQHQQINHEFEKQYAKLERAEFVGPKTLAYAVYRHFVGDAPVEAHVQYGCIEHYTGMARKFLAKRNDPDNDDNEVNDLQGDFGFSGQLQDRYPIPRKRGEEPLYKKRHLLTADERAWNVSQLRKSARSRQEHADALEAEGRMQLAA